MQEDNPWGTYDSYNDVQELANELGHQLANTRIDSTAPATVEHGEYSEGGRYGPVSVTIQELETPNNLGDRPNSVRIYLDVREVLSKDEINQPISDLV